MHARLLLILAGFLLLGCTSTPSQRVTVDSKTVAPVPPDGIGWTGIRLWAETGNFGEGIEARYADCITLKNSRLLQKSLVRNLRRANGVNPRCVVTFKDYGPKFALGTPLYEPKTICVDAYVSSPSGIMNHGEAELECDVYVYEDNQIIPSGGTR